jgi:hypothetical protein
MDSEKINPLNEVQSRNHINPYDSIGVNHNSALMYILVEMNKSGLRRINSDFILERLIELFPSIFSDSDFILRDSITILGHSSWKNRYLRDVLDELSYSNMFDEFVFEMADVIMDESNYEALFNKITNLEYEASKALNNDELMVFLIGASIARHSAKFWIPENQGGNYGIKYLIQGDSVYSEVITASRNNGSMGIGIVTNAVMGIGAAMTSINANPRNAIPSPGRGGMPPAGLAALIGAGTGSAVAGINQFGDCGGLGGDWEFHDDCDNCDPTLDCDGC